MFQKIRALFDGKKTYIGAFLQATTALLWSFDMIDGAQAITAGAVIKMLTDVALRLGVKKSENAARATLAKLEG